MNIKRISLVVLGIMVLTSVGLASAKEDDRVTISGGTLTQPIDIKDNVCIQNALSMTNLQDVEQPVETPLANLGDGYLITRYTQLGADSYQPFDSVRYYADPQGGLGYVKYLGMADGTDAAYAGTWFHPKAQSDLMVKYLLAQAKDSSVRLSALAKGMPDKVVISSPGLPHDLEITNDACMLSAMAMGNLQDPGLSLSVAPKVNGYGYLVTRYSETASGSYMPFDAVRFYVDPQGGRAYVYDVGGSGSSSVGEWFRPTQQSEFIMENLILNPDGTDNPYTN